MFFKNEIRFLADQIEKLKTEINLMKANKEVDIIGEVRWTYYNGESEWYKITRNEIFDQVKDYYKIGTQGIFSPRWFSKDDVIIYKEIDPFIVKLNVEKQKRKRRN